MSNRPTDRTQSQYRVVRRINTVVLYILLSLLALIVLYPLVYIFASAFSPQPSLQGTGANPFAAQPITVQPTAHPDTPDVIPEPETYSFPTLYQFRQLLERDYLKWYGNTLIVALASSLCTILITTCGAYIFSRFRFPLRRQVLISFLILQIFPSFVGMVAIYVILLRLNGLNTLWGLVLVYVAGNIPYNTWLVKGYMDSIPKSYDEAARIDGASALTIFFRVVMPIARPIITFLAITSFTGPWMDFIFPRMILRSAEKKTLAIGLFDLINGQAANNYTMFAAGAVMVAIPFVIFFLIGQRSMITVFGAAGVKE